MDKPTDSYHLLNFALLVVLKFPSLPSALVHDVLIFSRCRKRISHAHRKCVSKDVGKAQNQDDLANKA
jgi:hypothetical protein